MNPAEIRSEWLLNNPAEIRSEWLFDDILITEINNYRTIFSGHDFSYEPVVGGSFVTCDFKPHEIITTASTSSSISTRVDNRITGNLICEMEIDNSGTYYIRDMNKNYLRRNRDDYQVMYYRHSFNVSNCLVHYRKNYISLILEKYNHARVEIISISGSMTIYFDNCNVYRGTNKTYGLIVHQSPGIKITTESILSPIDAIKLLKQCML